MPDRRRHFLSGLLALAASGPLAASPATDEKLKAIMQAAAARPPDAERLREREALLRGTTPAALAQRADDLTAHRLTLQELLPKAETAHEQQARADALAAQIDQAVPALTTAETAVGHLTDRQTDAHQLLES